MKQGNREKESGLMRIPFPQLVRAGKAVIFLLLIAAVIVLVGTNFYAPLSGAPHVRALWLILPASAVLLVENAVKFWGLKSFSQRIACYVIDTVVLLVLTYATGGSLTSVLFIIILSEFYLSQEKLSGNIAMGASCMGLFLIMLIVTNFLRDEEVNIGSLVSNALSDLVIFVLHFLIINFTLQVYRKNMEIAEKVEKLNESNALLRAANEELKSVAVIEERQRVAREIHDTAGHSITTVIMQTEAAKLAIERDPQDARRKIIAANLQARHALEELRESVHLLSGASAQRTLREQLLEVIAETTDGTDIVIRYEIDDVRPSVSRERLITSALKEGLSNGLRHGGATAFWFELHREGEKLEFLLSDNGTGAAGGLREGFGLRGLRERVEQFGGSMQIESQPDEGFEIHITLPIGSTEEGETS